MVSGTNQTSDTSNTENTATYAAQLDLADAVNSSPTLLEGITIESRGKKSPTYINVDSNVDETIGLLGDTLNLFEGIGARAFDSVAQALATTNAVVASSVAAPIYNAQQLAYDIAIASTNQQAAFGGSYDPVTPAATPAPVIISTSSPSAPTLGNVRDVPTDWNKMAMLAAGILAAGYIATKYF